MVKMNFWIECWNILKFKSYGPVQFPLLSNVLQSGMKTYCFGIKVERLKYTFPQPTWFVDESIISLVFIWIKTFSIYIVEMFCTPQHWKLADFQNLLRLAGIEEVLKKESWRRPIRESGRCFSQLFQPSPSSQELEAWATQGHSDQDTGMLCHIDLGVSKTSCFGSISTWDMNWMSRIKSWTDILWGEGGQSS